MAMFLTLGCKKEQAYTIVLGAGDSIVFGTYFGYCLGENCVELYKIENGLLYEDGLDNYPPSPIAQLGNFKQLSNTQYQIAQNLFRNFPTALLEERKEVLGLPDGGDWGGYYIELNRNGQKRRWFLDTNENYSPAKYHSFGRQIREAVQLLQQRN